MLGNWFAFPGPETDCLCEGVRAGAAVAPAVQLVLQWYKSPCSHTISRSSSLAHWYTDAGRGKKKAQPRERRTGHTVLSPDSRPAAATEHAGRGTASDPCLPPRQPRFLPFPFSLSSLFATNSIFSSSLFQQHFKCLCPSARGRDRRPSLPPSLPHLSIHRCRCHSHRHKC